ncbi:hypothetical protein KIN20_030944 [Parelaphostrongylus tenuis]|uniref:SCP domain-containing protein n=1 Tax=Parelaphostrongylus tenuis TaxID=148309 RepID=A0AAD5WGV6_PARTN|nr:hypothetical protein KIN20_030944 [Parelaphostrongylus tenuis]
MKIIVFVLTLVVKFQNSIAHIWGEDVYDQKCIDDAKCDETGHGHNTLRLQLLVRHNEYRILLANGTQKNGKSGDMTFPTASNMGLLTYDCELEKIAFNISKMCLNATDPNFDHIGSNSATFHTENLGIFVGSRDDIAFGIALDVADLTNSWWSTSISDTPLVNLTPTCSDRRKIPFLQMANAATTRFGCSFSICNESSSPFVSFVCQYGKPHVDVNVPIYKEGPQCGDCNDSCVFGALCNSHGVHIYSDSMRPCWNCSTLSCIDNSHCVDETLCVGDDESDDYGELNDDGERNDDGKRNDDCERNDDGEDHHDETSP